MPKELFPKIPEQLPKREKLSDAELQKVIKRWKKIIKEKNELLRKAKVEEKINGYTYN